MLHVAFHRLCRVDVLPTTTLFYGHVFTVLTILPGFRLFTPLFFTLLFLFAFVVLLECPSRAVPPLTRILLQIVFAPLVSLVSTALRTWSCFCLRTFHVFVMITANSERFCPCWSLFCVCRFHSFALVSHNVVDVCARARHVSICVLSSFTFPGSLGSNFPSFPPSFLPSISFILFL